MKLVHGGQMEFQGGQEKHRGGGLATKLLLAGDEGTPENFRLTLGRDRGGHQNPRHRHNFDQIRVSLQGTLSITPDQDLEEGQVGYFPEGTWYGPQAPAKAERITLVLQFGGASGAGFISTQQMQQGFEDLARVGEFSGGVYRRDGKNQDAFEAIWEHVCGRTLAYPAQRYNAPIIMTPANFGWIEDAAQPGIARKNLGRFTERGTFLTIIKLTPDAAIEFGNDRARLLVFALSGQGHIAGEDWSPHSALQLDPDERATVSATTTSELLVIGLPMLG